MILYRKESRGNALNRSAFQRCFKEILQSHTLADSERIEYVLNRLFDIFDTNNDGVCNFVEFATGLSVLCVGDREEKIKAAFSLYDENEVCCFREREKERETERKREKSL